MLPLVEFPQIVRHYAPWFETVFSVEALVQFQRYLDRWYQSNRKAVFPSKRVILMNSPI